MNFTYNCVKIIAFFTYMFDRFFTYMFKFERFYLNILEIFLKIDVRFNYADNFTFTLETN